VLEAAHRVRAVVTVENHSIVGGLAGAVAEVLAREGVGRPLESVGIPDRFIAPGGSFDYLAERIGLTSSGICAAVERVLGHMDGKGRVS
jgi:transketolase C-terminal domain/subunit